MFVFPDRIPLADRAVELQPLELSHGEELFEAARQDSDSLFHHMFFGPFSRLEDLRSFLEKELESFKKIPYTVYSKRLKKRVGSLALTNLDTTHGTAEIGSVWYSRDARGSEINTHAVHLLLTELFDTLGYRRVVWKCDETNGPSRSAALALGFQFEGVFRNHFLIKGRSRDTAWYSVIQEEWPDKKKLLQERMERKDRLFL